MRRLAAVEVSAVDEAQANVLERCAQWRLQARTPHQGGHWLAAAQSEILHIHHSAPLEAVLALKVPRPRQNLVIAHRRAGESRFLAAGRVRVAAPSLEREVDAVGEPLIGDRGLGGHIDEAPLLRLSVPVLHPVVIEEEAATHARRIAALPALAHILVFSREARIGEAVPAGCATHTRGDAYCTCHIRKQRGSPGAAGVSIGREVEGREDGRRAAG